MDIRKIDRPVPFAKTFDALLGIVYDTLTPEEVRGHFDINPALLSRGGAVSSGVYTTVAEGAASIATASDVVQEGMAALGLSIETTLTDEFATGRVTFVARRRPREPDLWV